MNTFVFTASSSNSYSSYKLPGDVVLHLVHLLVLHLLHLLSHHHLIIIQHLPNRQQPTTNTIVTTGIRFDPEFYSWPCPCPPWPPPWWPCPSPCAPPSPSPCSPCSCPWPTKQHQSLPKQPSKTILSSQTKASTLDSSLCLCPCTCWCPTAHSTL